ncbi:MAG TPA: hypothetical protein VK966_04215, partial [Longimicrobiales bacterium]|nr:hypothetical protein [Longimicrobiales bacterium]
MLVLISALVGPSALMEPIAGDTPAGSRLDVGWPYLLLAPAFNVLDTLSLLTINQHYAVLATLIATFVVWRLVRRRKPLGWLRRLGTEVGVAALSLAGLLAFYGFGMVGHRPMAALATDSPDDLIVDFHSHTEHSHDSRDGFTAADRREWHASAGFHAAYIADHRTYQGYSDAAPDNPERAGEGTVLLPGLEIKYAGKYASVLGPAWRYRNAMDGNDLIADSLYRSLERGAPRPTLVLTIPGGLDSIPANTNDSIGYVAVEVNDAAPRGLEQGRRDRQIILDLADSLDLALVASSNSHGWGRTAAAWTVMTIPGWQSMTPLRLSQAIEERLHRYRGEATRVVERRMPYAGSSIPALAVTVPAITWQMMGGLRLPERVSWLAWVWALALIPAAIRRRRARKTTTDTRRASEPAPAPNVAPDPPADPATDPAAAVDPAPSPAP